MYCDTSRVRLGCVFMKNRRVIAYSSRKLRDQKTNYPTHNLDLAVVVFSLKIWRHYLYDVYVNVLIDHKCLKYLFSKWELNVLQRMWLDLLKYNDMNVLYHLGMANVVADVLSRMSMDSVDLDKKMYRLAYLGVCFLYINDGGVVVQNDSKSSLVV